MHSERFKKHKFNKGFTLAEVLITLVIIGIIAAMTVPAIIQNSNESATVSKVKKGLSVLGQAKILAEAQNGPIQDWNFGDGKTAANATQFWGYIRPHLQVAQDCGFETNCYQSVSTYLLNGSNTNFNQGAGTTYYKFVLSDGSVMMFRTTVTKCASDELSVPNECAIFMYDVNGDKAPNTYGRDIFFYVMTPEGVFPIPVSTGTCKKNSSGYGCSGYIVSKSDMKYLH